MSVWAIIPVKSLAQSKSRLTAVLAPKERADLTCELLHRTLAILRDVEPITRTLVVSRDPKIRRLAQAQQALTLAEAAGAGLNGAVAAGTAVAARQYVSAVLILPSDLPLLTAADVRQMLASDTHTFQNLVRICSDRAQQGTNALLLPPQRPFRFQFGPGSFHKHRQEARRLGMRTEIVAAPRLQFDLDTAQDWHDWRQIVPV